VVAADRSGRIAKEGQARHQRWHAIVTSTHRHGGSFGAGNYALCGAPKVRGFLFSGRTSAPRSWEASRRGASGRTIKREALGAQTVNLKLSAKPRNEKTQGAIREQLSDKGTVTMILARRGTMASFDPLDTRDVLGLAMARNRAQETAAKRGFGSVTEWELKRCSDGAVVANRGELLPIVPVLQRQSGK